MYKNLMLILPCTFFFSFSFSSSSHVFCLFFSLMFSSLFSTEENLHNLRRIFSRAALNWYYKNNLCSLLPALRTAKLPLPLPFRFPLLAIIIPAWLSTRKNCAMATFLSHWGGRVGEGVFIHFLLRLKLCKAFGKVNKRHAGGERDQQKEVVSPD